MFHFAKIILLISRNSSFYFEVLGQILESGSAVTDSSNGVDSHAEICKLSDSFLNVLCELCSKTCCLGRDFYNDKEFTDKVPFMSDTVQEVYGTFGQYVVARSHHQPWFVPHLSQLTLTGNLFRCDACSDASKKLLTLLKNAPEIEVQNSWEDPSSSRHLTKMSPDAVIRRHKNLINLFHKQKRQLSELKKAYDMKLCEQSASELAWAMETIDSSRETDALTDALREAGPDAEQVWKEDLKFIKESFWKDQQRNKPRKNNNRFNLISYRIALAVHHRSPAAYQALQDFEILALPSESSLKKISARNKLGEGIHEGQIADQLESFKILNKRRCELGLYPALPEVS
eukprot:Pompholyxophrys_punicea_v1_NODE_392_length_2065_cov_2.927861.p1 type:complete len:344 gc:universal NODE_392_length_2065_cov_2.927861:171-1202(+)